MLWDLLKKGQICKDSAFSWVTCSSGFKYCSGELGNLNFLFHSVYTPDELPPWTLGQVLKGSELITYDLINKKLWEAE